jgi:hypothetical protein
MIIGKSAARSSRRNVGDRPKTMCRQKLRNEVPEAGKPALSCRLYRPGLSCRVRHRRCFLLLLKSILSFAVIRHATRVESSDAPCSLPRSLTDVLAALGQLWNRQGAHRSRTHRATSQAIRRGRAFGQPQARYRASRFPLVCISPLPPGAELKALVGRLSCRCVAHVGQLLA